MELYTFLRAFADSWGLLALMLIFVCAIAILFRPGASAQHKDAAAIPLRDDTPDRDTDKDSAAIKTTNSLEPEEAK